MVQSWLAEVDWFCLMGAAIDVGMTLKGEEDQFPCIPIKSGSSLMFGAAMMVMCSSWIFQFSPNVKIQLYQLVTTLIWM
jgi:hypothetical protein